MSYIYFLFQTKECVELALQLQGKKIQNREIRIKRIETKNNTIKNCNKVVSNVSASFKRKNPVSWNSQKYQGEIVEPKMCKKVIFSSKSRKYYLFIIKFILIY